MWLSLLNFWNFPVKLFFLSFGGGDTVGGSGDLEPNPADTRRRQGSPGQVASSFLCYFAWTKNVNKSMDFVCNPENQIPINSFIKLHI